VGTCVGLPDVAVRGMDVNAVVAVRMTVGVTVLSASE
jgi:hypothetical protein